MKSLGNLSYHRKVFMGMMVVSILPILLYFTLTTQVFSIYSTDALSQEAHQVLEFTDTAINTHFEDIFGCIEGLASSGVVKDLLGQEVRSETPQVYRQLYVYSKQYGSAADFCIYDENGSLITYAGDGQNVADKLAVDWGALFEAGNNPDACVIRNGRAYQGNSKIEFLRAAKCVTDDFGNIIGYAVAVINGRNMDYILTDVGMENRGIVRLYDDFDERVYSSGAVSDEAEYDLAVKSLLRSPDSEYFEGADKNYRYYILRDEDLSINIFYRQAFMQHNSMLNSIVIFGAVVGVISILFCLFMSSFFAKRFYSPIGRIRGAIDKISKGDYSTRINTDDMSKDELGRLSENVNSMAKQLDENTKRLVERERELGNTNIKMMQAQLNPHFIYNTLDTIKWLGKSEGVPEVATISSGLAQILRTSISAGQFVTLQEELKLVEAYVEIQKIRFSDKFEFVLDVDENLLQERVPKLILQPAIENSIVHGFEESEHGRILVTAEACGDEIHILVQDDGVGMPEETLNSIKHMLEAPESEVPEGRHGIGIRNVHSIIRLNYGEPYGLDIESDKNGTKVMYRLPYKRGGLENV